MFVKFEDIEAWKLSRELVKEIYQLTSGSAFSKDWGLRDQIQRAVVSIGSNIAEGHGRRGNKEMVKFLWIAKGSASEVQSQLYSACDLGYLTQPQFDVLYNKVNVVQVKIYNLIKSFSAEPDRQKL